MSTNENVKKDSHGRPHFGNDPQRKRPLRGFQKGWKIIKRKVVFGEKGIIVTCQPTTEEKAAREIGPILVDHMRPYLENLGNADGKDKETKPTFCRNSISQELDAELAAIRKGQDDDEPVRKMFDLVHIGASGSFFASIRSNDIDPADVVLSIFQQAKADQSTRSRHIVRLVPVHTSCYSKAEDLATAVLPVIEKYMGSSVAGCDFVIYYRARNNNSVHRDTFIKTIHGLVPTHNRVNLDKADKTIIIEIFQTICFFSIVSYYDEMSKLNLRMVVEKAIKGSEKRDVPVGDAGSDEKDGSNLGQPNKGEEDDESKAAGNVGNNALDDSVETDPGKSQDQTATKTLDLNPNPNPDSNPPE